METNRPVKVSEAHGERLANLGTCPAEVDMVTGEIFINKAEFDKLTDFQKNFVLLHEAGHFKLNTDLEDEADRYALQHLFRTEPYSLRQCVQFLGALPFVSEARLFAIYKHALQLDAEAGNEQAKEELKNIMKRHNRNSDTRRMDGEHDNGGLVNRQQEPYDPEVLDDQPAPQAPEQAPKNNRTNEQLYVRNYDLEHLNPGLWIGDYYISFTNLMLFALLVLVYMKLK